MALFVMLVRRPLSTLKSWVRYERKINGDKTLMIRIEKVNIKNAFIYIGLK